MGEARRVQQIAVSLGLPWETSQSAALLSLRRGQPRSRQVSPGSSRVAEQGALMQSRLKLMERI